ncbi:hypothetical protein ACYPKM_02625 [Pseudomonas aeruginosa]
MVNITERLRGMPIDVLGLMIALTLVTPTGIALGWLSVHLWLMLDNVGLWLLFADIAVAALALSCAVFWITGLPTLIRYFRQPKLLQS